MLDPAVSITKDQTAKAEPLGIVAAVKENGWVPFHGNTMERDARGQTRLRYSQQER